MYQVRERAEPGQKEKKLGEASRENLRKHFARFKGSDIYFICEIDLKGQKVPGTEEII